MDSLSMVEIAAKQRHVLLLKKVRNNQPLTAGELRELQGYESTMSKKTSKKTNKKKTAKAAKKSATKAVSKRRGKPPAALVKCWAMKYDTMAEAEEAEGLTSQLNPLMKQDAYARAWERGKFLRHLAQLGGQTSLSVDKVAGELSMTPDKLRQLFQSDHEAADAFNEARRKSRRDISAPYLERAKKGDLPPSVAMRMMDSMRLEIATPGVDFEHVTTEMMCELFNVSRITLNNWVNDYGAPRNAAMADRSNTYNLSQFIEWFKEFQIAKVNNQPGKYLGKNAPSEGERLKNRKTQMLLDEMDRKLVPVDQSMASYLARSAAVDKYLAAETTKLYLELADMEPAETKTRLKRFIAGLRAASCELPANYPDILPEVIADGFIQLMEKLASIDLPESEVKDD